MQRQLAFKLRARPLDDTRLKAQAQIGLDFAGGLLDVPALMLERQQTRTSVMVLIFIDVGQVTAINQPLDWLGEHVAFESTQHMALPLPRQKDLAAAVQSAVPQQQHVRAAFSFFPGIAHTQGRLYQVRADDLLDQSQITGLADLAIQGHFAYGRGHRGGSFLLQEYDGYGAIWNASCLSLLTFFLFEPYWGVPRISFLCCLT